MRTISFLEDARSNGNIIPFNLAFDIKTEHLEILKKGSNFNYIILIKVGDKGNGFYDSTSPIRNDRSLSTSAHIKIIDIGSGAIAYDHLVIGKSNSDFSKPTAMAPLRTLSNTALRKGLNDLKKYSVLH